MVIRDFFTITSYTYLQEVEMTDQQAETENYGAESIKVLKGL